MKLFATLLLSALTMISGAQTTATDFNVADCEGKSHGLFAELEAGKVVVIVWVMPCIGCINGALTAQSAVQDALVLNPGKVVFWIADDYANTLCKSLTGWCETNGVVPDAVLRDKAVSMSAYGEEGMPKVLIVAGKDHKIFYNKNSPYIEQAEVNEAMSLALVAAEEAIPTLLKTTFTNVSDLVLYPNPTLFSAVLHFSMVRSAKVTVEVRNMAGIPVREVYEGNLEAGAHNLTVVTSGLPAGEYVVSLKAGSGQQSVKLLVEH